MTTTETERAERAALDAWAKAEDDRNREGYWLAMTLMEAVKAGSVTLPDYLASRVAEFQKRCAAHDKAREAHRVAYAAVKAEAVEAEAVTAVQP